MDFLKQLNPAQHSAVTAADGPNLILAGPGSGKTRVLTQRIAYLIGYQGVRPYQMLAVTFTNKAAREMQTRVTGLLGEEMTRGLLLGTFHATCSRILRREAERLPVSSDFVIFDADDQQTLVKNALRSLNLDEKSYRPVMVHAAISRAKNELIGPKDFPIQTYRDKVVQSVYTRYEELLRAANAVDFDDLLLLTTRLLEEYPDVQEKYASRFHQVLVDEFQDTNMAQYNLLKRLSSVHGNLFVVGDPDQSVYAWRGADYRNVQRFEKDFPQAQVILLEQNYRSSQTILDTAMAVIDKAAHRRKKKLFTERGQGEKVIFYEAVDDYGEAAFVVDTIAEGIASKRFQPGDFAVMYRTNAQSRLLEEAFIQAHLPYRLVGAQRFYGRREIKDIISFLRLAFNPDDELSLSRVINLPPRGIGEKSLLTLLQTARAAKLNPGQLLLDLARGSQSPHWSAFSGRAALPLADFGGMLAKWHTLSQTRTVPELFDSILQDVNYREYLEDGSDEGKDRLENVQELRRLAEEYATRSLSEFLENIALVSDQDTIAEGNAPTLLTMHAAKGLEFGVVFITGLDDGILPHSRSFDEPEQMEEERRLFYVGITRAKEKLYLLRALRRGGRGYAEETVESRFLNDIPPALLSGSRRGRGRFQGYGRQESASRGGSSSDRESRAAADGFSSRRSASDWKFPSPPQPAAPRQAQFSANMRVHHPVWGDGQVLESRLQADDEIVDVAFDSVGIKRLAASLARLTILPAKK